LYVYVVFIKVHAAALKLWCCGDGWGYYSWAWA